MTYAVLFKIYFIDAFVIRQLDRLKASIGQGDLYVIADETQGELGAIPHDRVIRVTEREMSAAGFAHGDPTKSMFWHSADYSLYCLFERQTDYDHYVTVEYDAVVRGDLDQIVDAVAASGLDFVGEKVKRPMSEWPWARGCEGVYPPEAVRGHFNAIAFYTRRVIGPLRQGRLDLSSRLLSGEITRFPVSEAYIPTELGVRGFRIGELSEFGDTTLYDWWPPTDEADLDGAPNRAFIHPVLEGQRYRDSLLRPDQLRRLFSPQSPVPAKLQRLPARDYIPTLTPALIALRRKSKEPFTIDPARTPLFERAEPGANIAIGKPATQSSVSPYSRNPQVRLDAAGAVNGLVTGSFGFHTGRDSPPWWMVDLEAVYRIAEIWVFNRLDLAGRARGLRLLTSTSGRDWRQVYEHPPGRTFGGAYGTPLMAVMDGTATARFVRIELPETQYLHLDQVKIFGDPVESTVED